MNVWKSSYVIEMLELISLLLHCCIIWKMYVLYSISGLLFCLMSCHAYLPLLHNIQNTYRFFAVEWFLACCLFSVLSHARDENIWFSVWMSSSSNLWTCALRLLDCTSASRVWVHVLRHALVWQRTHILTCWDIGLANRVLYRSASPDSSLKCPWQPPNPQLSFPLCSCTFFSLAEPLMDAAIFLCLSPLECSHNHWAL